MAYDDIENWDVLYQQFCMDITENGFSLEGALLNFIENYTESDNDEQEEPLDVYFERKMKPMWDYVYNLNKENNKLKVEVALLKESNAAKVPYGPVKYPNNIPPTHEYPLDWYKVTANGNVPLSGSMNDTMATTGYMQVVDTTKYTTE